MGSGSSTNLYGSARNLLKGGGAIIPQFPMDPSAFLKLSPDLSKRNLGGDDQGPEFSDLDAASPEPEDGGGDDA